MKLFHGSIDLVAHPKILQSNRRLDYGDGFYTTTSEQQAQEWVTRRMVEKHAPHGHVNIYELDIQKLSELKILLFIE